MTARPGGAAAGAAWLATSSDKLESVAITVTFLGIDTTVVIAAQTARSGAVMLVDSAGDDDRAPPPAVKGW